MPCHKVSDDKIENLKNVQFELGLESRVFLLCHLWIVNYYVKSLLINLGNEDIKTGVSRELQYFKNSSF